MIWTYGHLVSTLAWPAEQVADGVDEEVLTGLPKGVAEDVAEAV
eukprot:CAMPEP_0174382568 /NCGR_PEP_ID=MMETSP0811_2-20130205/124678_1 /TAXON_ID=73025 ORGANISM="Eutreptiella gymnastica-like, Strain CCMP1594" /NCGR_SAMPLE_ID=MMETSP0811_2 /ASSEMBLY_ACC=CAM_ASM_000667 /LENGTH=43 /DNA_ID= /DNA_START= /DNA_END= /DNA_ORIENTATION=